MMAELSNATVESDPAIMSVLPPRERILQTAREMFHQYGIHAIGVEAIATAAGTNKMTLYRHFSSKDELIEATIREIKTESELAWEALAQSYLNAPQAHLKAWLDQMYQHIQSKDDGNCQLMHKVIEIPDAQHPARLAIDEIKHAHIQRITKLCQAAGLVDAEALANKLFIVFEGARVSSHMGAARLQTLLPSLVQGMIIDHQKFDGLLD